MTELKWGSPSNSNRCHIFSGGRSLCLKWMYLGGQQSVGTVVIVARPGDCKDCVRRFNKMFVPTPSRKKQKKGGADETV